MTVRGMLGGRHGKVKSVPITATLRDTVDLMTRERIGAVVVLEGDGALAGIVTERDVVMQIGANGADALDKPVSAAMTLEPTTCSIAEDAYDAIEKMASRRCRHLPVVENGAVVGMVSSRDVMENIWAQTSEQDRRRIIAQIALA